MLSMASVMLLTGCSESSSLPDESLRIGTTLAPCTMQGTAYAALPFRQWPQTYHGAVTAVVDAHLQQMGVSSGVLPATKQTAKQGEEGEAPVLDCSRIDEVLQPATPALIALAQEYAPWQAEDRIASLSRADTAAVLLEHLRVYECAWKEALVFDELYAQRGMYTQSAGTQRAVTRDQLLAETLVLRTTAAEELLVARAAMNRTLVLLGGYERVGSFRIAMECLARASLDLRNSLGLLTEAGACLPRAIDKRGSLRDLQPFTATISDDPPENDE